MQNEKSGKLDKFFAGKGFYIVLALCVIVIGISAYSLVKGADDTGVGLDPGISAARQTERPEPSAEPPVSTEKPQPVDAPSEDDVVSAGTLTQDDVWPEQVTWRWPVSGEIERGYSVEALHGGLDQPTRDRVMRNARSGKIDAIVATDVAARGIDLENLTHVINFGIPASYETYVHRIGRTGRAGRTGTAITILEPREHRHIRALERATRSKIEIRTVPSATDVQAKRLEVTRGAIAEILAQGGLERYNVIVEALCEEHDPIEVAAAAVRLALESEGTNDDDMEIPAFGDRRDRRERSERPERPRRERGEPEEGMTRLFIGAGRMSGVRPGDIVGAIANEANVSSRQIGAIDISDRFTLAEVDSAVAQQVIDALQGVRFKGRPITVKLDQGAPREERSDRGRSDRFEREGRNDRYDRPERKRFDRDDRSERYSRFDDDNRRRGPRR